MKKLLIIILLFSYEAFPQNRNSIWVFGDSAGVDFSNLGNPTPINTVINTRGSCCGISDSSGHLQFYAFTRATIIGNSGQVYNSQFQMMDQGDSIVGEGWYEEMSAIQFPGSNSIYLLFSLGETGSSQFGLYYSVIDMSMNAGLGKVVQKNIQLNSLPAFDGISIVKHGNGRDVWALYKLSGQFNPQNNVFFNYLFTPFGIADTVIDSLGTMTYSGAGFTSFSKDGSRYALCTWNNLLEVFDFDRCSGHLSNSIIIEPENPGVPGEMRSIAFSSDGSRLYLIADCVGGCTGGIGYLIQYDLLAANIQASRDTIYTFIYPEQPFHVRLAPDDKIYLSSAYDNYYNYPDSVRNYVNENLSVINHPNNLGTTCDFQPFSFYLGGKRTYYGLPNNPDYEMGPLIGSGCDSLPLDIVTNLEIKKELKIFYHTVWQTAFINASGIQGKNYSLQIFDITGKQLFAEQGKLSSQYFTKDFHCNYANGIYIISLATEKEKLTVRFIIQ